MFTQLDRSRTIQFTLDTSDEHDTFHRLLTLPRKSLEKGRQTVPEPNKTDFYRTNQWQRQRDISNCGSQQRTAVPYWRVNKASNYLSSSVGKEDLEKRFKLKK